MSAHVVNDPQLDPSFTDLHRELAPTVLEKCRELVSEYSALAKADPAAFPFSERDLLEWYGHMKNRMVSLQLVPAALNARKPLSMPRRTRRGAIAA